MLHHRELGGAGRPPLILLHGFLGSSRNWQTAGAGLAEHYHVWALDLRNHGRSPHAPEMDYPTLAGDVLEWMAARGMARASLLGHSLGGKVAMWFACREPARVERLVVVDIAPKDYPGRAQRAEIAAMRELRLDGLRSRAEAELRFESRVESWAMRKFLATNLERDENGQWRWIVNLPALAAAQAALVANPLGAQDRFEGPALFVLGGKSRFVDPEDHELIRRHFPRAAIAVIPGAGHNPHLEAREEFVRLVAAGAPTAGPSPRG